MAKILPLSNGSFPSENVDPRTKEQKKWLIDYANAAFGCYSALPEKAIGYKSRERYNMIRSYALAMQDFQQYRDLLEPNQDDDENGISRLVVEDRIIPVIPNVRGIAISHVVDANSEYDITINPIDPTAAEELSEEIHSQRSKIALRQAMQHAGLGHLNNLPEIAHRPGEPDDLEGARVAQLGLRHQAAMDAELLAAHILNANNYSRLREGIAADLIDYGAFATRDWTRGDFVEVRQVDMRGFICNPLKNPDKSDMFWAGEIQELPVSQVIEEAEGWFDAEEMETIFNLADGKENQGVFINASTDWAGTLAQGRVQVLDFELLSTDTEYREMRVNRFGNLVFGKAAWGADKDQSEEKDGTGKKRSINSRKVQNVYCIKWIVGTDLAYSYGRQVNVKLDGRNPTKARLSFHLQTGYCTDMIAYSRTENFIPFANSIQLRRMKLEHNFNTALPKGYMIDLSALEDIAIDAGGQNMSPRQILDLLWSRGIVLFRSASLTEDDMENATPVKDIVGGLGPEIAEFWNDIQHNLEMMKSSIGINEVTDGSAPNPKRLNEATQAAITGTKNALKDLFRADANGTLELVESCIIRAQNLFRIGKGQAFVASLGTHTIANLARTPIDRYTYGFTIEDRPSPEALQVFEQQLTAAMENQSIGADDVARIRSMTNLKQKTEWLVYAVRKTREIVQQQAQQNSEQQAQVAERSARATEEEKRKTFGVEYELRMKLTKLEKDLDFRNDRANKADENEQERIASTGRVNASLAQAGGRDHANARDNTTKLIEQGMEDKVPQINTPAELTKDINPVTSEQKPFLPGIDQMAQQHFSFLQQHPVSGQSVADLPPEESEPSPESQVPADTTPPAPEGQQPQPQQEAPEQAGGAPDGVSEQQVMGMLGGSR